MSHFEIRCNPGPPTPAGPSLAQHLRALRRDRYQCQYAVRDRIRCLAPAAFTRRIDGRLVAVCLDHRTAGLDPT